ncbi:MAG: phosphatase PAP2 family protein [Chlamydiales bacterium]|nr:phosphatase PAP2 family protein [Chlamydiales bacterium]
MDYFLKRNLPWLLPILFLAAVAPFTPYLDLAVSSHFYLPGRGFYNNAFFQIIFRYGELFGLATGGCASLLFGLSFLRPEWKKWRRGAFAITGTLVIGAGLLTNVLLKGYWGRPRPKQVEQFSGKYAYRPFWQPDFDTRDDPQRSFPSGHVAMGFYFLSVCLVGRRTKNLPLFTTGLILTVGLGGSLMVARVVQGGHFLSDVIASPILMWLVAIAVDRFTWGEWGERILFLVPHGTSQESDETSAA